MPETKKETGGMPERIWIVVHWESGWTDVPHGDYPHEYARADLPQDLE